MSLVVPAVTVVTVVTAAAVMTAVTRATPVTPVTVVIRPGLRAALRLELLGHGFISYSAIRWLSVNLRYQ
jgi:hypothetical protein